MLGLKLNHVSEGATGRDEVTYVHNFPFEPANMDYISRSYGHKGYIIASQAIV